MYTEKELRIAYEDSCKYQNFNDLKSHFKELNQGQSLPIDGVSGCQFETYARFCIECDRKGMKPVKYKDYLEIG